jgi:hypothetical protein
MAHDLRSALLKCTTVARDPPGFIALVPITPWGLHTLLKKAGWVTSNPQPQLPLILQRYNLSQMVVI